jgi:hypothetical protein
MADELSLLLSATAFTLNISSGSPPTGPVLHNYFAWANKTTTFHYHQSADDVPNGLSIPRWSWNGLQV